MNFGIRSLEEDVHEEASKLKSLQVPLVEISAWKIRSTNYYKIPEISVGAPLWFVQLESSRNEHGGSSEKVVLFFFPVGAFRMDLLVPFTRASLTPVPGPRGFW